MFRDQTAETTEAEDDKEPRQRGRWISGRCERQNEHCSLMDLAQEDVHICFRAIKQGRGLAESLHRRL